MCAYGLNFNIREDPGGGSHGLVALSRVHESNQVGFALLHRVCGGEKMV